MPIGQIKRRNHIEGDSIYHLKFIVIPDPKATPTNRERTEDMKIEEFMAHMSETVRFMAGRSGTKRWHATT